MPRKQNQKSDAEPKGSSAAGSPNSRRNLVISDKQSNWKSFVAGSILGVFAWLVVISLGLLPGAGYGAYFSFLPCGAVGGVIGWSKLRPVNWVISAFLALLLLLVAFTPIVQQPALNLIVRDKIQHADAVVVLSAGISRDNHLSNIAADRLLTGMEMIRRDFSDELVVTRIGGEGHSAEADQDRLISLLPGKPHVHRIGIVLTTRDEALHTRDLAKKMGWRSIILVTSPLHSYRAKKVFENVGLKVISNPAVYRHYSVEDFADPSPDHKFFNKALDTPYDRINVFADLLYEKLGIWLYRRRGWID